MNHSVIKQGNHIYTADAMYIACGKIYTDVVNDIETYVLCRGLKCDADFRNIIDCIIWRIMTTKSSAISYQVGYSGYSYSNDMCFFR